MEFHPNLPIDRNKAQRLIWNALKNALSKEEGVAYYRYPIFSGRGSRRREPDFLILTRRLGVWVLEAKGCHIDQILAIEGHDWQMINWYCETMSPVAQVEDQMFAVKNVLEQDRRLRKLNIPLEYRVVLPFIKKDEWRSRGYNDHPSLKGIVWLEDDLDGRVLRTALRESTYVYMPELDDSDWERLKGVFRGVVDDREPVSPPPGTPANSPRRVLHAVEDRLRVLDEKQERVAQEVPDGPQRIRGLAGTGKTILLARRVARMHAANPDWEIALIYWSRSLNGMMRDLVERTYRRLTGEAPNWRRLHVWHAWGGNDRPGFYRDLAERWDVPFYSLNRAKRLAQSNETPFAAAMRMTETHMNDKPAYLDALVIDEGQDLPSAFYRIAYQALRTPKRLYWAYDEAQGIDSLVVPHAAEVFGREEDGRPRVDLSGFYPGGIRKAHNLNRCYRTPKRLLAAAHAINMGLLRDEGPLQGVTSARDWMDLGYEILSGDFSAASVKDGKMVVLARRPDCSGHPIDAEDFPLNFDDESILQVEYTASSIDDVEFVASSIKKDIADGLKPEHLAVVILGQWYDLGRRIAQRLAEKNIDALLLGDKHRDVFTVSGAVTISGIRRAKGNEAWKVYALNLHEAGSPYVNNDPAEELVGRNQVFVALTRAKLWCVAAGRQGAILDELLQAGQGNGQLRFKAFNKKSLKRSVEDMDQITLAFEE